MIAKLGAALNRWATKWVPDPLVLALLLTALVAVLGTFRLWGSGEVFWPLAEAWLRGHEVAPGKFMGGFSNSGGLTFALQMCLVLVTGHAIALSPPVQRGILALSRLPRSAPAATVLVAFVALSSALIHWGLGAIAGALLAREIGRHSSASGLKVHYPILGAAAYSGMAVWHGGLSGSAPLKVADGMGQAITGELSLLELLLSPVNLVVTGSLLILIPLVLYFLTPRDESALIEPPESLPPVPKREARGQGVVAWLQESRWVGAFLGLFGLALVVAAIQSGRMKFAINSVNLLFLCLGMVLQGSLRDYMNAVSDGARGAGAIIIQFPLYFGILGLMASSGLIADFSQWFADVSSSSSFPVLTYLSAGAVNMAVPSGGGQWAVQADVLLGAGQVLSVDPRVTIMAFSYGDAWTNMLQPFWALPLLGIMGLRARDIIGYTAVVFLLMAVVVPVLLLVMA